MIGVATGTMTGKTRERLRFKMSTLLQRRSSEKTFIVVFANFEVLDII